MQGQENIKFSELNFYAVVCAELREQIWLYRHIQQYHAEAKPSLAV